MRIEIPPGVEDGTRIRYQGEGEAGVFGGPSGDLYVVLNVKEDSSYAREGNNLHCMVSISFPQAALGTVDGEQDLHGVSFRVRVSRASTTERSSGTGRSTYPRARMNAREQRHLRGVDVPGVRLGRSVLRLDAFEAIRRTRPDLVLAAWLPPGALLDRLIRAPVRHVLEIGAKDGVTPSAWSWRFAHELRDELERQARCRLDERPGRELHSRVTLYYGARHPWHARERVRPGDWLWQFRPA